MGLAGEQRVVGKGVLRALQDLLRGLVSTLQRILSHYGVIGSLAFQQDLSNHSLKNGLDKAGSCKQAVYGGRGVGGQESRREMVWQGLEQRVEKSGRIKDQLKGYNWQAAVTAWMQGGRASKEMSQGGTRVPTLDNAWMLVLVFKPENTGRAAG